MSEAHFHYPDSVHFHEIRNNTESFLFSDARKLSTDEEKLQKLSDRINGFYSSSLNEIKHPFSLAILTCVGVEVMGQIFYGFHANGDSIAKNTIEVYNQLDPILASPITSVFKSSYNNARNTGGTNTDFTSGWNCYAEVLRKGLRNTFTHSYRSLGVFLIDSIDGVCLVDETLGVCYVNPYKLRIAFHSACKLMFEEVITNPVSPKRTNAIKYFELLIR